MRTAFQECGINEIACGTNFAYVLDDGSDFSLTEYKVMQGQSEDGFVKCMKMLYNGKTELYYISENRNTLEYLLPSLDADGFLDISYNLLACVRLVQSNGFLSCCNIDIASDKVFIDPTTRKTSIVYMPINRKIFKEAADFENELRSGLIKIINDNQNILASRTRHFAGDLANGALSVEDILKKLKGVTPDELKPVKCSLTVVNSSKRLTLTADKPEYVIGRNPGEADGLITFNPAISKRHCKILTNNRSISAVDMNSSNHTFLNGQQMKPNKEYTLKNGDVIKLADTEFRVSIG